MCIPLDAPDNGEVWVSSDGLTINFTCNVGYSIKGNSTTVCSLSDTGWDSSAPTCSKFI